MGLVQWIIIIVLIAIIIFGFSAVFDFSKGTFNKVFGLSKITLSSSFTPPSIIHNLEDGIVVANVSRIIDGDTFELDTGEKVRLTLINTPEKKEQGYVEAKNALTMLCQGKEAVIDMDNGQTAGSYSRLIGWVDRCGDFEDINKLMIQNGFAKVVTLYCKTSEFKQRLPSCV